MCNEYLWHVSYHHHHYGQAAAVKVNVSHQNQFSIAPGSLLLVEISMPAGGSGESSDQWEASMTEGLNQSETRDGSSHGSGADRELLLCEGRNEVILWYNWRSSGCLIQRMDLEKFLDDGNKKVNHQWSTAIMAGINFTSLVLLTLLTATGDHKYPE